MPSRRKYSHSNEPHWFVGYNQSNQQYTKSKPTTYDSRVVDEDTWSKDETLYKDSLHEVLAKWKNLDDGIWSKIIYLERNRRVAKAYARFESLHINDSDVSFNGSIIGLNGFDNEYRSEYTRKVLQSIGNEGLTLHVDVKGNIWIEHRCKCSVFTPQCQPSSSSRTKYSTAIGRELEVFRGRLPPGKSLKLFDMSRFRDNVSKEYKSDYPDIANLQSQCISVITFGSNCLNILESPASILIINIVALQILRPRLLPVHKPLKDHSFKTVAGSVWQSVRRLASRSSNRDSVSNMFDRSWRSPKFKEENPYYSLTSVASYADVNSIVDYGGFNKIRDDPSARMTYTDFNQFRISTIDNRMRSSTIDFRDPKIEPMPDYDTTSSSSSLSIYKESHQNSPLPVNSFNDWSTPKPNQSACYPFKRLNGPLNSVFRAFPVSASVVDLNSNQPKDTDINVDSLISTESSEDGSNGSTTSPESTDEADNHIYSSISDSKDGKSSSDQTKSESSDQYGEINTIEEDEETEQDQVEDSV